MYLYRLARNGSKPLSIIKIEFDKAVDEADVVWIKCKYRRSIVNE